MSTDPQDHLLDETIRRAVGSETADFDAAAWLQQHGDDLAQLATRRPASAVPRADAPPRAARRIRTMKIAIPAAAAAALAIAIVTWTIGSGASIAMAAVLEQLHARSYEFTLNVHDGNSSTTATGTVLEPGRLRLDMPSDLGAIVSITDHSAGRSLLLYERPKIAYQFEQPSPEELAVLGFLILPGRSISDLWSLQAGHEVRLPQKRVDGRDAQGFQVTQEGADYAETITVWADAETAAPIEVTISCRPRQLDDGAVELTLRNFQVVAQPDPTRFGTAVPPGYTLANWRTLKELTTGSTANTQATPAVSPAAAQLLAALQSWHAGEREQALAALLKLDWQSDFRFAATDYLFTMTEAQCVSLVPDDKQQMLTAVMSQTSDIRAIARELVERAKRARAAGDHATAEQHLRTAAGLGELLDRDRDGMLIVRMVGIAVQRLAFTELAEFYEATGNADELQAARTRLADLAAESKAIKDAAAGQ